MGERPKVVVDVQFQGQGTECGPIAEQFEFELVGKRIYVRPCAADHPQGALYSERPRKRPASPRSDPRVTPRVASPKRSPERQQRAAKPISRPSSPKNRDIVEQLTKRCIDRGTSPCFSIQAAYEDFDERFPPSRKRLPPRTIAIRDDSNTSFSSYRVARRQTRQMRKDNSMWNISKREADNYSVESSASLGNVNYGYCVHQDADGNYSFTKLNERDMAPTQYDRYNTDLNDDDAGTKVVHYRNRKEKKCTFSCHECCSNKMAPSVVFEEVEMFASTETIKRESENYKEDDDEEGIKKEKVKLKSGKKESRPLREPDEYEEIEVKGSKYKALESKEPTKREQKSKGKDKKKEDDKQESKNDKALKTATIKEEDNDDESDGNEEDEITLKKIRAQTQKKLPPERGKTKEEKKEERKHSARSKTRLSPESEKMEEEKKAEREENAQSQKKLSPERGKTKEEKKEERNHNAQSQIPRLPPERAKKRDETKEEKKPPRSPNRLSPESSKKKEDNKEERVKNLSIARNCCLRSRYYRQDNLDE